jgi:hypothetical protein
MVDDVPALIAGAVVLLGLVGIAWLCWWSMRS